MHVKSQNVAGQWHNENDERRSFHPQRGLPRGGMPSRYRPIHVSGTSKNTIDPVLGAGDIRYGSWASMLTGLSWFGERCLSTRSISRAMVGICSSIEKWSPAIGMISK